MRRSERSARMSRTLVANDVVALGDGLECQPLVVGGIPDRQVDLIGREPEARCIDGPALHLERFDADLLDRYVDVLARLRFRVTVNTDNRLMSDTTMSKEFGVLAAQFGYGWADFERFTVNAMKSAFIHFDERLRFIDEIIKPGYAVLIG